MPPPSSVAAPQVCDQPHPLLVKTILSCCLKGDVDDAYDSKPAPLNGIRGWRLDRLTSCPVPEMQQLWQKGYAAVDIISVIFRVTKSYEMPEFIKLEFVKVRTRSLCYGRHAYHTYHACHRRLGGLISASCKASTHSSSWLP